MTGYDANGDGTIDVGLPAMGASPRPRFPPEGKRSSGFVASALEEILELGR